MGTFPRGTPYLFILQDEIRCPPGERPLTDEAESSFRVRNREKKSLLKSP